MGMQADLAPGTAIHNSLLRAALANGADADQIEQSIASMRAGGVQPDVQSYTVLLRAHGRQGDALGAAAVMSHLQALGRYLRSGGLRNRGRVGAA